MKSWEDDTVLIESDWNLKFLQQKAICRNNRRINRIRLEFKGDQGEIL